MLRATFSGSAYVGVFASAIGDAVLVRRDLDDESQRGIGDELGVPVIPATVGGASTVGSLVVGNRHGVVLSGQADDYELERLTDELDRPIERLPGTLNAAGNIVLANDEGALIHPDASDEAADTVAETLSVDVSRGSLGGVKTVGMAGVATNAGALTHPQATEEELDRLESTLSVRADVGTINYGSPLVGAGLIVTEHGYVAGERTTGPELGRIEDALDLID